MQKILLHYQAKLTDLRVNKQFMEEKILAKYISDKGILFKIQKKKNREVRNNCFSVQALSSNVAL